MRVAKTKLQHSLGPWEVLSAEFKGGGVVAFEVKMPQPQLNFADKHLIESAHEMYEALKELVYQVGKRGDANMLLAYGKAKNVLAEVEGTE